MAIITNPEVLAPAGDRERLEAAIRYGANAVYLGGHMHNMRAGTPSFSTEQLADAVNMPMIEMQKFILLVIPCHKIVR